MEKNRITPVKSGKNIRMSYSRQKEVLEMPNLIEVQRDSYDWFLTTGLREVLDDISPIEDYAQNLSHEFIDFRLCEEDKKYSDKYKIKFDYIWLLSGQDYIIQNPKNIVDILNRDKTINYIDITPKNTNKYREYLKSCETKYYNVG